MRQKPDMRILFAAWLLPPAAIVGYLFSSLAGIFVNSSDCKRCLCLKDSSAFLENRTAKEPEPHCRFFDFYDPDIDLNKLRSEQSCLFKKG